MSYSYDNSGQYDELNRLQTVDYGDGQTQGYQFDPMGNRLSKTDTGGGINGTEGYSYNAANMLLSRAGNAYTNDLNGNTLTGGGRTNVWDSENRMVSCTNGANVSSFVYSSDGLRHQSTVNGVTTDFVLDNSMFIRERRNGSNIATYLVGARGPEYRRDDTTGTVRWYLYNGVGSVLGEVDPNGNLTSSRKYDVYGAVRGGNNSAGTSKHKFVGQLGHPSEDETGLIYMQARYYDPLIGRFASEDIARDGINWYAYCLNDPINHSDATGNNPVVIAAVIIAFLVAAVITFIQTRNLGLSITVGLVAAGTTFACFFGIIPGALVGGVLSALFSYATGGSQAAILLIFLLGAAFGALGGATPGFGTVKMWAMMEINTITREETAIILLLGFDEGAATGDLGLFEGNSNQKW